MSYFDDIREFHNAFKQPAPDQIQTLPMERRYLRRHLITEEYEETMDALAQMTWRGEKEIPHLAKELADLIVVCLGTAVEMGIPFDAVWEEVHRSNMSKLGADGKPVYREDGKVLKGKDYSPADIERILYDN